MVQYGIAVIDTRDKEDGGGVLATAEVPENISPGEAVDFVSDLMLTENRRIEVEMID